MVFLTFSDVLKIIFYNYILQKSASRIGFLTIFEPPGPLFEASVSMPFRKSYAFDIRKMYTNGISLLFLMLFFNPLKCKNLLLALVFSIFLDRRESTVFYHFWFKNRLRSIGDRRAPSPNALFSTLWRPISAQRHFFSFLHFFQLFSSFCMNGFFLKILRFALVKHTFVKTLLMNSSVYAFFGRHQTTKILLLTKVKLTFPKKS